MTSQTRFSSLFSLYAEKRISKAGSAFPIADIKTTFIDRMRALDIVPSHREYEFRLEADGSRA